MGWVDFFDGDAIHDNVAAEISALTEKAVPVATDWVLIEDAAASNAKKKAQLGNLPGGGGGGDFSLIGESVLTSDAAQIEFSSIASTFLDLMMLCELRTDRAAVATDELIIRVGTGGSIDAGNNYSTRRRYEGNTANTLTAGATAQIEGGIIAAATAVTGSWSATEFKIFGYADTDHHKLFLGRSIFADDSIWYDAIFQGRWKNTAAINIIRLISKNGANFITGSRAALYGLG